MRKQRKAAKSPKPTMKWQVGEYKRSGEFRFIISYQFLLLSKIVNVTPEQFLIDFMDNLSCSSWKREGRDEVKGKLIEYFLSHRYGQDQYNPEEIKEMFKEMDAIGLLFPRGNNEKLLNTCRQSGSKIEHLSCQCPIVGPVSLFYVLHELMNYSPEF